MDDLAPFRRGHGHQVGEIVLALGIVVGDLGQQGTQQISFNGDNTRIAKPYLFFFIRRINFFPNAGDIALIVKEQPAITSRIRGGKGKDDKIGPLLFARLNEALERLAADQGHIAVKNEHRALKMRKLRQGLHDRVRRAQPLFLRNRNRAGQPALCFCLNLRRIRRGHHHGGIGFECCGGIQNMTQHRAPGDGMQHLRPARLHAGAEPGSENDNGDGMHVARPPALLIPAIIRTVSYAHAPLKRGCAKRKRRSRGFLSGISRPCRTWPVARRIRVYVQSASGLRAAPSARIRWRSPIRDGAPPARASCPR